MDEKVLFQSKVSLHEDVKNSEAEVEDRDKQMATAG